MSSEPPTAAVILGARNFGAAGSGFGGGSIVAATLAGPAVVVRLRSRVL